MASPDFILCWCPIGNLKVHFTGGKISAVDLLRARPPHTDWEKSFDGHPKSRRRILRALRKYFLGKADPFLPLDCFSLDGLTPFTRSVILGTRRISNGSTVTYTEFARLLNLSPSCRRAVGGALGRNPLPLFFPCHRIIGAGGLGGFSGGRGWKRKLLVHEGADIR